MIRRNPTRIEFRLDDMNEYNAIRCPPDNNKDQSSPQNVPPWPYQILLSRSPNMVHERIGYVPQPRTPS